MDKVLRSQIVVLRTRGFVSAPIVYPSIVGYRGIVKQDRWLWPNKTRLRVVPVGEEDDPWTHIGAQPAGRSSANHHVASLVLLLVLVGVCYFLMRFIP